MIGAGGDILCNKVNGTVNYAANAGRADSADSAIPTYDWRYAIMTNCNYLASRCQATLPVAWPV